MFLLNGVKGPLNVYYPESIGPYVQWCGTCQPGEIEADAILKALIAVSLEIKRDPPNCGITTVNVVLLDRDSLELSLANNPEEMGSLTRLVILPLHRWRQRGLFPSHMTTAVVEEFVHAWYYIDDELLVERKVAECLRHLGPSVRVEDVYNPHWKPDDN